MTIDNSVKELVTMIENVTLSSDNISSTIVTVAEGSMVQIQKSRESYDVAKVLSANSETIREKADFVKDSSEDVISMSISGTKSVKDLMNIQLQNQNAMCDVNQVVASLVNKSNRIEKFSNIIKHIAKETHLLSINASIEASRGGAHADEFKVIAKTIRKLTNQTKSTAEEISTAVTEIKKISRETLEKLQYSNEVTQKQDVLIFKTVETFKELKEKITKSIGEVNDMHSKIEQLFEVRGILDMSITEIVKVTESNSAVTQEVSAIIQEQLSKIEYISLQARKLNEESDSMKNLIENLNV